MEKTNEEVVSKEISKALRGIDGEVAGKKILDAISSFCDANDFMLYGLMGAGMITATATRKKIRKYRFLVNKEKARDVALIKSLVFGGRKKEGENPEFSLVASYPPHGEFREVKGLESLYPMLCRLIISVDRQLVMANPFFDDTGIEKLKPYIKKAVGRGVRIKIISRESYASSKGQIIRLKDLVSELGEHCEYRVFGGALRGKPFYLHAKFMVADTKRAYVGSANITETSLGNNVEVGVIFTGKQAKSLLNFFNLVWKNSSEM